VCSTPSVEFLALNDSTFFMLEEEFEEKVDVKGHKT